MVAISNSFNVWKFIKYKITLNNLILNSAFWHLLPSIVRFSNYYIKRRLAIKINVLQIVAVFWCMNPKNMWIWHNSMSKYPSTRVYQIPKTQFEFLCYEIKVVLKKLVRCHWWRFLGFLFKDIFSIIKSI